MLEQFFEWPEWESLSHIALVLLYVYVIYTLFANKDAMTFQNVLLCMIVIALTVLIHQNVNDRSKRYPKYFV